MQTRKRTNVEKIIKETYLPCISVVLADDSGMPSNASITSKRKHWATEHKLESVKLYKKYENKNRAAKRLQSCYKVQLNS